MRLRFSIAVLAQATVFTVLVGCSALFGSDFDGLSQQGPGSASGGVSSTSGGVGAASGGRLLSGGRDAGSVGATGGHQGGSGGSTGGGESGSGTSTGGLSSSADASYDHSSGGTTTDASGGTTTGGARHDADAGHPEGGVGTGGMGGTGGATGGAPTSGGAGGATGGAGGTGGTPSIECADADAAPSYPPAGARWNDGALQPFTYVPVCFTAAPHVEWNGRLRCENQVNRDLSCSGDPFTGTDVATLQEAFMDLIGSWARVANVEFVFYECAISGDGGVSSSDASSIASFFPRALLVTFVTKGKDAEPLTHSVSGIGKHDFGSDLHVDWQGLRDRDPDTLRAILRETGRVLGFPYEWLRDEKTMVAPTRCPACYTKDPDVDLVSRPTNLVDFYSVMDRCTPTAMTRPGLSPGDAIGAKLLYGDKQDGGLVDYRGYCADVYQQNTTVGTPIVAFPCRSQGNDSWCQCSSNNPRFEATFSGQRRCMGVSGNAVSSSGFTPDVSQVCDQSEGQRMPLTNVEWRAMGNMCLVPKNGRLETAFCDGSPEQKWNFMDGDPVTPATWDQIQNALTGDCVTTRSDAGLKGEFLFLSSCSPSNPRQHFRYIGNGFIQYGSFCMNVEFGVPAPGFPVFLWIGCGNLPSYNMQFYLSGSLKSFDQCLSTRANPGSLDEVGVEPCSPSSPRQVWDYHFPIH